MGGQQSFVGGLVRLLVLAGACVWAGLSAGGCGRDDNDRVDLSSPKGAVATLQRAIERQNGAVVRQVYAGEMAPYGEALARLMEASKKLSQASEEKFGREQAKLLPGAEKSSPGDGPDYRKFQDAREEKGGGGREATLTTADGWVMKLREEGGQWKVVAEGLAGEGSLGSLERAVRLMSASAEVMDKVAGEVAAGEFSKGKAEEDIKKVREAVGKRREAAWAGL